MSSELSLPSSLVGRLIGKGGETVKELERLTGCRISIPRRSSRQAENDMVCIQIRCVSSKAQEEALRRETRCLRSAQLVSVEGLSVSKALAQADAERQAQELIEEANVKEEQEKIAAQRISISWPEFAEADIRAALRTCCDDEDAAIDILLGGFRVRTEPHSCQASKTSANHPRDKLGEKLDEYPLLYVTSAPGMDVAPKSFTLGRPSSNAWVRRPKAKAMNEDFPSLPTCKPQAPANVMVSNCGAPTRMNRFTRHSRRTN